MVRRRKAAADLGVGVDVSVCVISYFQFHCLVLIKPTTPNLSLFLFFHDIYKHTIIYTLNFFIHLFLSVFFFFFFPTRHSLPSKQKKEEI